MRRALPTVLVLLAATLVPACGGFKVTSSRNDVPTALLGAWQGDWESDGEQGDGFINVQVQEFDSKPVISIELDNPCIAPREYQLAFQNGGFELRAGDVLLRAEFTPAGELAGVYSCPDDTGTWRATRFGDLPEILDLSGSWDGTVAANGLQEALQLEFGQSVGGGAVRLQASVLVPEFMPSALPMLGFARFREDEFEVLLSTPNGVLPAIQAMGVGDRETREIQDGVMIISGGVGLPFASAVWSATQQPQ